MEVLRMRDHAEETAAAWALRHPLDAAERAELDAWLAQDHRHAGALLRAQAGLSVIDRAVTGGAPIDSAYAPPPAAPTRRCANVCWPAAGSVACCCSTAARTTMWSALSRRW